MAYATIVCHRCGAHARKRYRTTKFCSNSCRRRAWHEANREGQLEAMKAYAARVGRKPRPPTEASRERTRQWKRANPLRVRELNRRRDARKLAAFIEPVDPTILLELHDGCCVVCGSDVDPFDFEIEHDHPLSRGGFHNYENCGPAHKACNLRKGTRTLEELTA